MERVDRFDSQHTECIEFIDNEKLPVVNIKTVSKWTSHDETDRSLPIGPSRLGMTPYLAIVKTWTNESQKFDNDFVIVRYCILTLTVNGS